MAQLKLNSLHPWMLCVKFGGKWPNGPWKRVWDQICSNEGSHPFPSGDNNKIAKKYQQNINLLDKNGANFIQIINIDTYEFSILGWRGLKYLQIRNINIFLKKELGNVFFSHDQHYGIIIVLHKCFPRWALWPMGFAIV